VADIRALVLDDLQPVVQDSDELIAGVSYDSEAEYVKQHSSRSTTVCATGNVHLLPGGLCRSTATLCICDVSLINPNAGLAAATGRRHVLVDSSGGVAGTGHLASHALNATATAHVGVMISTDLAPNLLLLPARADPCTQHVQQSATMLATPDIQDDWSTISLPMLAGNIPQSSTADLLKPGTTQRPDIHTLPDDDPFGGSLLLLFGTGGGYTTIIRDRYGH